MVKGSKMSTFNRMRWTALGVTLLLVGVVIGIVALGIYEYSQENHNSITDRPTAQDDGNLVKSSQEDVITAVADKVSPSVVSIVTGMTTQTIFGAASQEAAGTGIIVSKDGYILTNRHVVNGATKIEIVMTDGTTYDKVKLIGTDPLNDVAYLKVEGVDNLIPAVLGDSSTIRVGQQVIAIGNSLGQFQNTVTSGIISGKGRPISAGDESGSSTESLTDLLQTDAAINPGNSGGPLLNTSGQVIGMNTAVAANAQGIGFAIPINATKGTLKSVLAGKGVQRSYLGLRYVELTPVVAKRYKLSVTAGAFVKGQDNVDAVIAGGPAAKAGVKDSDIITKINGMTVGKEGGVSSLIGEYAPGDTVELTVRRGNNDVKIKVTLETFMQD